MSQNEQLLSVEPLSELGVSKGPWIKLLMRSMRPHQWVKNLFVLAPLLFAKKLGDPVSISSALLAFLAFCGLASGLYIFNDWLDIEEDRAHPEKRNRPLSSGQLPVWAALSFASVLVLSSLAAGIYVSTPFFMIAALYFAVTLTYCVILKRLIILDCMTIAAGFVLRVVGGAVAINVAASHWLIVCAYLLALFLAFSKRRQEILSLDKQAGKHRAVLNEYSAAFLAQVNIILIGASIVCYALYTVAPETIENFSTDKMIYGTIFVMYGLLRYMSLTESAENGGNPSQMLLRDRPLLITVAAWAVYNASVIYRVKLSEIATFPFSN